jgi:hypothetical protein
MKKIQLIVLSLLGVCSFQAQAQFGYYQDALRFSQTNWVAGSSARMQGLAGTQVSLGGDVSSSTSNPAGLGFFNRSAAAFTLGLGFQNSDDQFAGLTTPNFHNTFGVSNASVVMNFNKGRFTEEKFKGGSLGISIAKVNDFNREFRYEGESGSSLLDLALSNWNSGNVGGLEDAFFDQFLIDQYFYSASDPSGTNYFPDSGGVISPNQTGEFSAYGTPILTIPYQQESISQRGSQHQINVSWGGNYDDKIYFGGGLGIQTVYYSRSRTYIESEFIDGNGFLDPYLNSLTLSDQLVTRGGGVNTSFGMIFRPVDMITIGVSYQSPTFLTMNEESDFTLRTNWEDYGYEYDGEVYDLIDVQPYRSAITETKYKIKTPSRLNLGGTVFLGKKGFISADVEMVDYANAELQSGDFSPLGDNQVIINNFTSVLNYRTGAEFRFDNIRVRGGYAYMPDPVDMGSDRNFITFGVGYKTADYFIDFAIINSNYQQQYQPYAVNGFDLNVDSDVRTTQVGITAGFNF